MCWVAADRGARLAEIRGELEFAARWQSSADEIKNDICERALDERGVFTQHYDTDALDASAAGADPLPATRRRAHPQTVRAIAEELTEDGLVLRYRPDETDDGLSGEEGTFTICSFWLVSALVEIGEIDQARDLCGKLLGYAEPLGLYAEEIDARSGRHLGNFPQAFTHLALINAVMHVIRGEQGSRSASCRSGTSCRGSGRSADGLAQLPISRKPGWPPAPVSVALTAYIAVNATRMPWIGPWRPSVVLSVDY